MVWSASGVARSTIHPGCGPRGTYGLAESSLGSSFPRVMKFSRDSLPDRTGPFTTALVRVFGATEAGALYAIIVFLIGFILGTIRVLLVAPRLGDARGQLVRLPLVRGLHLRRRVPARSLMGLVAFLVLMSAEACKGAVFGRSLGDQRAAYGSLSGAIGLAAQVIFAMFPVIQVWRW